MTVELVKLDVGDPKVAAFLAGHPTYLFQEPVWLEALRTLGHEVGYWCLTDGDRLVLVQPAVELGLVFFRLLYFGLPYGFAVGDLQRYGEFIRLASDAARKEGFHRIRISRSHYDPPLSLPGVREQVHVQHILHLGGRSEEEVWRDFKRRVRHDIRVADRRGVKVVDAEAPALRDAIFDMYLKTMKRNEALPLWTRAMLDQIWETIVRPGNGELLVGLHEGEPLSGLATFYSGRRCFYFLGTSSRVKRSFRPNDALFWEAMRRAMARGCEDCDFMISPHDDQPLIDFKAKWGTEVYPFTFWEADLKRLPCRAWDLAYTLARTKWGGRLARWLKGSRD